MKSWQMKGNGKGKQQSFLQMAMESAVVNALGLADFGSNSSGKGGGKGGGNGKSTDAKSKEGNTRQCKREACRAARNRQGTWGGMPNCHCCGYSLSMRPPLDRLL